MNSTRVFSCPGVMHDSSEQEFALCKKDLAHAERAYPKDTLSMLQYSHSSYLPSARLNTLFPLPSVEWSRPSCILVFNEFWRDDLFYVIICDHFNCRVSVSGRRWLFAGLAWGKKVRAPFATLMAFKDLTKYYICLCQYFLRYPICSWKDSVMDLIQGLVLNIKQAWGNKI